MLLYELDTAPHSSCCQHQHQQEGLRLQKPCRQPLPAQPTHPAQRLSPEGSCAQAHCPCLTFLLMHTHLRSKCAVTATSGCAGNVSIAGNAGSDQQSTVHSTGAAAMNSGHYWQDTGKWCRCSHRSVSCVYYTKIKALLARVGNRLVDVAGFQTKPSCSTPTLNNADDHDATRCTFYSNQQADQPMLLVQQPDMHDAL